MLKHSENEEFPNEWTIFQIRKDDLPNTKGRSSDDFLVRKDDFPDTKGRFSWYERTIFLILKGDFPDTALPAGGVHDSGLGDDKSRL